MTESRGKRTIVQDRVVTAVGAAFSRLLYDPRASRIANLAFAAALVATTVLAFIP